MRNQKKVEQTNPKASGRTEIKIKGEIMIWKLKNPERQ